MPMPPVESHARRDLPIQHAPPHGILRREADLAARIYGRLHIRFQPPRAPTHPRSAAFASRIDPIL